MALLKNIIRLAVIVILVYCSSCSDSGKNKIEIINDNTATKDENYWKEVGDLLAKIDSITPPSKVKPPKKISKSELQKRRASLEKKIENLNSGGLLSKKGGNSDSKVFNEMYFKRNIRELHSSELSELTNELKFMSSHFPYYTTSLGKPFSSFLFEIGMLKHNETVNRNWDETAKGMKEMDVLIKAIRDENK